MNPLNDCQDINAFNNLDISAKLVRGSRIFEIQGKKYSENDLVLKLSLLAHKEFNKDALALALTKIRSLEDASVFKPIGNDKKESKTFEKILHRIKSFVGNNIFAIRHRTNDGLFRREKALKDLEALLGNEVNTVPKQDDQVNQNQDPQKTDEDEAKSDNKNLSHQEDSQKPTEEEPKLQDNNLSEQKPSEEGPKPQDNNLSEQKPSEEPKAQVNKLPLQKDSQKPREEMTEYEMIFDALTLVEETKTETEKNVVEKSEQLKPSAPIEEDFTVHAKKNGSVVTLNPSGKVSDVLQRILDIKLENIELKGLVTLRLTDSTFFDVLLKVKSSDPITLDCSGFKDLTKEQLWQIAERFNIQKLDLRGTQISKEDVVQKSGIFPSLDEMSVDILEKSSVEINPPKILESLNPPEDAPKVINVSNGAATILDGVLTLAKEGAEVPVLQSIMQNKWGDLDLKGFKNVKISNLFIRSDRFFQTLGKVKSNEPITLDCSGCTELTKEQLLKIAGSFKAITELNLQGTKISAKDLEDVKDSFPNLVKILETPLEIKPEMKPPVIPVAPPKENEALKTEKFGNFAIKCGSVVTLEQPGAEMKVLQRIGDSKLNDLELKGFKKLTISNELIKDFVQLLPKIHSKELIELDCSGCKDLTKGQLWLIAERFSIRKLNLKGTNLSEKVLEEKPELFIALVKTESGKLKESEPQSAPLNPSKLEEAPKSLPFTAEATKCGSVVTMKEGRDAAKVLLALTGIKDLETVELKGLKTLKINDELIKELDSSKVLPKITSKDPLELDCSGCTKLTYVQLLRMASAFRLKKVDLRGTQIAKDHIDVELECFKGVEILAGPLKQPPVQMEIPVFAQVKPQETTAFTMHATKCGPVVTLKGEGAEEMVFERLIAEDWGVSEIKNLKNLKIDKLINNPKFLGALAKVKSEEPLNLDCSGANIAKDQLSQMINSFPVIEKLNLSGTGMNENLVELLPRLPYLKELTLDGTISANFRKELAKAALFPIKLNDETVQVDWVSPKVVTRLLPYQDPSFLPEEGDKTGMEIVSKFLMKCPGAPEIETFETAQYILNYAVKHPEFSSKLIEQADIALSTQYLINETSHDKQFKDILCAIQDNGLEEFQSALFDRPLVKGEDPFAALAKNQDFQESKLRTFALGRLYAKDFGFEVGFSKPFDEYIREEIKQITRL